MTTALGVLALSAACGGRTLPDLAGTAADSGRVDGSAASDAAVPDGAPAPDAHVLPACLPAGNACTAATAAECCSGAPCTVDGWCGGPPACGKTGATCLRNEDCCQDDCYSGYCGQPLTCQADGTRCTSGTSCCGGTCLDFECTCSADGVPCSRPSECCSSQCTSQRCGVNKCAPLSPAPCDFCVGERCCPQLSACELEPTCYAYLLCVQQCEEGGGDTVSCGQAMCASFRDPIAGQVDRCLEQKCPISCDLGDAGEGG
jgi:hypothetical protein